MSSRAARRLLAVLLFAVVAVLGIQAPAHASPSSDLANATNVQRNKAGLASLPSKSQMDTVAQAEASRQAQAGTSAGEPDLSVRIPAGWTAYSELAAQGSGQSASTIAGTWASGANASTLRGKGWTHIGTGMATSSKGEVFAVALFATYEPEQAAAPAPVPVQPAPAPAPAPVPVQQQPVEPAPAAPAPVPAQPAPAAPAPAPAAPKATPKPTVKAIPKVTSTPTPKPTSKASAKPSASPKATPTATPSASLSAQPSTTAVAVPAPVSAEHTGGTAPAAPISAGIGALGIGVAGLAHLRIRKLGVRRDAYEVEAADK